MKSPRHHAAISSSVPRSVLAAFWCAAWLAFAMNCPAPPARPDLVLTGAVGPAPVSVGELVTFNLHVTNAGTATASQVVVSNVLSSNADYFGATITQGTFTQSNRVVSWNVGFLAAGSGASLALTATPLAPGPLTNTATAAEFETEANPANNTNSQGVLVVPLTFYPGPSLNIARAYHVATTLADGRILITGGMTATGQTTTAELYDPQTRLFTLAGNMQRTRAAHAATRLNDGTVLITGMSPGALFAAEIYNPTSGTFTSISNTINPHQDHTSTLLNDGRVLLAGDSYTYPYNAAEIYVPALHGFTNTAGTLFAGTRNQGVLLDDGKVLLAGGTVGWSYDPAVNSELFNPATGGFVALPQLSRNRYYYGAAKLLDGRVLLAGGNFGGQQSADLYYPTSQSFVAVSNTMHWIHYIASANRLPDGKVLVAGYSPQTEVFNPTNESFARAVEMKEGRSFFTGSTLPDGGVLLVGGTSVATGAYLASSEWYDPARTKAPPAVSVGNASVVEGNSGSTNLVFNLTLSAPMGVPVSVAYETVPVTTYLGEDFVPTNGVVVFPPGVTNQSIAVTVLGDVSYEADEILNVLLSSPTNVVIDGATGTGTIINDDPIPTLTAEPASAYEGNRLTTNLTFNLYLSSVTYQDVTVDYATIDGTALAGSDYVATNGTVYFPSGSTNQTITVTLKGDAQVEPDETFSLQFSNIVNALPGTNSTTGTILDDDGAPGWLHHFELTLPPPPLIAGALLPITVTAKDAFNQLATNVNGRVLLSVGTTDEAPQFYGFEDGVLGDWTPSNGGQQPGPYEVKFFDVDGDGDASFAFRTAAGLGTDGVTRSVTLNGGRRYYVSGDFAQSDEGGGPNGGDTQAYLTLGNSTLATVHFGGVNSGMVLRTNLSGAFDTFGTGDYTLGLLFSRNPWFETYPIGAFADDIVLGAAPITPRRTGAFTNGVWTGTASIGLTGTNFILFARGLEGQQGQSPAFAVEPSAEVALLSAVAPGTPRVGSNLVITVLATNLGPGPAPSVVLTNPIPAGPAFVSAIGSVGSCTVTGGVAVCDFGALAPGQTASLTLTLRPATAGIITNFAMLLPSPYDPSATNNFASNVITISPALIFVSNVTVSELTGSMTNAVFQVTVGDPHSDVISADFYTVNGTALSNADYLATSGQLVFPPGVSTQYVSVPVLDDTLPEILENFRLQLANPANATLAGSGFGTGFIADNGDPLPTVTINDVTLKEGDSGTTSAVFTVSFDRPAGYAVGFNYATTNGTALATNDYTAATGVLNFAAGQTNALITVLVRGNTVNEPDEVFYLNLSTNRQSPPVLLVRTQAVCTILNDDNVPGRLDHFDWIVSAPRVKSLPFAVTLTARDAFNNVATNALTSIPLSATGGGGKTPGPITIAPTQATPFVNGVWSGNILINLAQTNIVLRADDGLEHIGLTAPFETLANIGAGLAVPASVNETNGLLAGQGQLTVILARPTNTTFNLFSSDTSEVTVPPTVLLPANATNVSFDLTAVDDALLDGTKKVTISATSAGYAVTNAVIAVHDNEVAVLGLNVPSNAPESVSVLGTVFMSAPADDDVSVSLASSDPTQLQVPATVIIPAGQSSNTFSLTPVNDGALDGPQPVLITAHVQNWTDATATITVLDDETNTVTITFAPPGASYYEGSGLQSNAVVRLGGTVPTNVTVTLTSSDLTEAVVPASVLIPAGTNTAFLSLTIPDDSEFDGTQTAVLTPSAPGFASVPVTITIGDNELHHFSFSALPAIIEGNANIALTILARDINDAIMTGFTGVVTLVATNNSGPVAMSPGAVAFTAGQWSGSIAFTDWEYPATRLTASAGTVTSATAPFHVVAPTLALVNAAGSDLAYSPLNGRLYVNTSSGSVTAIEAAHAQVEGSVLIGGLGTRMVASDDGQFLFLEQTGGNMCRFNVAAATADQFWSVGTPQIEDLAAVPGLPTAVAVARMDTSTSPRTRGTVIYNNGQPLPNGGGGNVIDFAAPSQRLYIYNNETTAFDTEVYDLDANGLTHVKGLGLMAGFGVNFVCRGGLIFATTGQIFDPVRGIVVGGNPAGMALAGDGTDGRFYYWQNLGGGQSAIVAADLHTLLPIGATTLPGVASITGSLIRWGTNGLAFRPNGSQVAVVRSQLVPAAPATDLVLRQMASSGATLVGGTYTCTFGISNAGPNVATNLVLSVTLPATTTLGSFTSPQGACSTLSGGLVCNIPSLASGATAAATLALIPTKAGPFAFKAGVLSGTADNNYTNNRITVDAPATFISGYDSVVELALNANDLVYDAAHARLCASVPNANPLLGNSIVTFDPLSAFYPGLIPTALEPNRLGVADDGHFLYASLGSEAAIQRFNLTTRAADLKFPTGYNGVNDLEVMPGHGEVVAATVHTTVAVYENGVIRPNVVPPSEYNFGYSLEFGASSNRLYASFPTGFRRIAVDTNGATLLDEVRGSLIAGYSYDMDYGYGLVFTVDGRVFDPESRNLIMTLPYSGLVAAGPLGAYAFYLTTSGSTATLRVIDLPTRSQIKAIDIPGVSGTPASLVRWGRDGLAFRTTGGQVFLIRATLVDDQDGDGLADGWETLYFGSANGIGGGRDEDPDGDGFTNYEEFRAGTNPLDPQSRLQLGTARLDSGQCRLSFATANGRRYRLEHNATLAPGGWTTVADNVAGTGGVLEIADPTAGADQGYYRLVLLP